VEKGGSKKYKTERNGRSSCECQGIIAFCTRQWNENMYITLTSINTPVFAVLIGTEEIPTLDGCNGVNPGFKDEMEKACCACDVAGGEARDDSVTLNGCCCWCCPVTLF